jgi:acetylornithine aminotransferase
MELSPVLAGLAQYPFARLDDWKSDATARGIELIDFGMGDPREVTPAFIREALVNSIEPVSSYPRATGLPELRTAIAGWLDRRFGVAVDDGEIVPTLGSKEAIFSFAQVALGDKRLVAVPEPAYPVYERGALFAGGRVVPVTLSEQNGWLPDLDAFTA